MANRRSKKALGGYFWAIVVAFKILIFFEFVNDVVEQSPYLKKKQKEEDFIQLTLSQNLQFAYMSC